MSIKDVKAIYLTGLVYKSNTIDTDGETMSPEDVRYAYRHFSKLVKEDPRRIDVMHNFESTNSEVVKTWVEKDKESSDVLWKLTIKVTDQNLIKSVLEGKYNGYSLGARGKGSVQKAVRTVTIENPDFGFGKTSKTDAVDHVHLLKVTYDSLGRVTGGYTNKAPDGHFHEVKGGTVTELAKGHKHSFVLD
jgi:hypothetical protein